MVGRLCESAALTKNLSWLAFSSVSSGIIMLPSKRGHRLVSTSCQPRHVPLASSNSWFGQQAMTPVPPETPEGEAPAAPPPMRYPSAQYT